MKKVLVTISTLLVLVVALAFSLTAYADERIDISSVELSQYSYTYTGKKIVPEFTVYDQNGDVVEAGAGNFTYLTSNATNVGTASIRVTGRNGYKSSVTVDYKIKPCAISSVDVDPFTVYLKSTPELKLKYNRKTLVKGVDYDYTVEDATQVGQPTVYHVTGLGNYFGTKNIKKIAHPNKVTGFKSSNRTKTGLTISWNSQAKSGVTNYKIYKCDSKGQNRKLVADTTSTRAKITGYNAGDYVYLIARSYVQINGTNYYSDYSKVYKTVTTPAKVSNTTAAKSKDRSKLKAGWNKAACTGYELQYSTDKSFKKNVKTVKLSGSSSTSKLVKINVNKKIYYTRVRAFREFKRDGLTKKVYGAWSNKLSTEYSKVYEFYKTPYPYNPNRTTNLKLACKAINGTILKPGETFSFNQVVGRRTPEKGYKEATIFTGSNGTAQSTGGGICQVASTLFNAALYCNFQIVERHQHSQRVAYCPLGRDAAIFWGSEDLKFKNTSDFPVKIEMRAEDGYVYCDIKVSYDVAPAKVKLEVSQSGNHFTLKRYANGKCNYTTKSTY